MHSAFAVGYRSLSVPDATRDLTFSVAVLYPTHAPPVVVQAGPYTLDVAPEGPIAAGTFPLVVISHGGGSTPWAYRTLAYHLVHHGYVVALPEHPFDNRTDGTWSGTWQNLVARPHHLHLAISALFSHPVFAPVLRPGRAGVIGHSMGGYTALASAGGAPNTLPWEAPDGQTQQLPVEPDERIGALVLLAPATGWFRAAGALLHVQVPVLLLAAEHDPVTPYFHSQILIDGLASRGLLTHRVVPNAGHFSFLSPFPAARISTAFPPSQDPPGFDRAQFQEELQAEIRAFLEPKLR